MVLNCHLIWSLSTYYSCHWRDIPPIYVPDMYTLKGLPIKDTVSFLSLLFGRIVINYSMPQCSTRPLVICLLAQLTSILVYHHCSPLLYRVKVAPGPTKPNLCCLSNLRHCFYIRCKSYRKEHKKMETAHKRPCTSVDHSESSNTGQASNNSNMSRVSFNQLEASNICQVSGTTQIRHVFRLTPNMSRVWFGPLRAQ